MRVIDNSIIRALFALALGLVLVLYPAMTINYMVIIIGVLFALAGLVATISYFSSKKKLAEKGILSTFPLEGIGSVLLGLFLIIKPEFFVNILMYVLGAILLLAGIQQIIMLSSVRKRTSVSGWFYLMPVVISMLGIVIFSFPFKMAANMLILIGISLLVYGVVELVNRVRFRKFLKKLEE